MRLIDADAPLDKIHNVDGMEVFENSNIFATHYERMVKSMPIIEERKTGKWIDGHSVCSICKWYQTNRYGFVVRVDYNYCPRCGAEMEIDNGGNNS